MTGSIPLTFRRGPWRLSMGLNALDLGSWIDIDDRYDREVAERERLMRERTAEVHAVLPCGEAGASETLALLIEHLPRHFPDRFEALGASALRRRADGRRFAADKAPPLLAAGALVQEDLCVMHRGPNGYELAAAILCFPSHWRLADKLGRPMREIHAPVPGFGEQLGGPTDRFFAAIDPDRPVWRANWSIARDPELHKPGPHGPIPPLGADDTGGNLWLRVERQTLRRLPRSGDVLFTIRTYLRRIAEVAAEPDLARDLAARLRELPEAMARYKALPPIRDALLAWLDRRAGGTP